MGAVFIRAGSVGVALFAGALLASCGSGSGETVTGGEGGCQRVHGQVLPPAPGLAAHAVSPRDIEVRWHFRTLPLACSPSKLLVTVQGDKSQAGETYLVTGKTGSRRIAYPDVGSPPGVVLASAFTTSGARSRVVQAYIDR